jgi:hypothetical protein
MELDYSQLSDEELRKIKRTAFSRSKEFMAARKEQNRRAALDPLNCIRISTVPARPGDFKEQMRKEQNNA